MEESKAPHLISLLKLIYENSYKSIACERWEEYKQLRLESLSDSPQSFLDDVDKSKKVEGVKKLELGVITTQEAAYQLYLSLGFRKVGEQKYSVKVGDKYFDEYLMEICFD